MVVATRVAPAIWDDGDDLTKVRTIGFTEVDDDKPRSLAKLDECGVIHHPLRAVCDGVFRRLIFRVDRNECARLLLEKGLQWEVTIDLIFP